MGGGHPLEFGTTLSLASFLEKGEAMFIVDDKILHIQNNRFFLKSIFKALKSALLSSFPSSILS